jgi:hypothetical protein
MKYKPFSPRPGRSVVSRQFPAELERPGRLCFATPLAVVGCFLLFSSVVRGQTAHLVLQGDPGEIISQGQIYDVTYTPANGGGFFFANVTMLTNGLPSFVDFIFGVSSPPHTSLDFATNQLGIPLVPGTYTDAQRADFATTGHPGLDVTFANRGSNTLTGNFTINSFVYAPDPNAQHGFRVISFDATFNQQSDGETPVLHGSFSYSSIPEPSSLWLCAVGAGFAMLCRGRSRSRRTPRSES